MLKKFKSLVEKVQFLLKKENKEDLAGMDRYIYKGIKIVDCDKSIISVFNALVAIDCLPNIVLNRMKKCNLLIRIDTNGCKECCKNCGGFYNSNTIYIRDYKLVNNFKNTLYHEISHFIDNQIGIEKYNKYSFISQEDKEYLNIFNSSVKCFTKEYGSYFGTNIECFAQAGALFLNKNIRFMKKYPRLTSYINNSIVQLNN